MRAAAFVIIALVGGYIFLGNPDVTYRSSDGRWADSEIQFKGLKFERIVWSFEGYKLKCNAPSAVLKRATPEYWFNPFAWPSYLSDRKWHVPYSDAHGEIGGYYPPVTMTHCYNGSWSLSIIKAVDAQAASYLARLK